MFSRSLKVVVVPWSSPGYTDLARIKHNDLAQYLAQSLQSPNVTK